MINLPEFVNAILELELSSRVVNMNWKYGSN